MAPKMKYTEEYLSSICKDKGLELVNIEKKFYNGKIRRMADFICLLHRNKGIQELPVEKIATHKKPCHYCNHSKLKETFRDEVCAINPNIEVLSNYKNWNTKVKCRCKIDGHEWETVPSVLLYGGGCPVCGYRTLWDKRGRITTQDIAKRMSKVNPKIQILGDYIGFSKRIKCKCIIDGREWESVVANLLNGSAGCPECRSRKIKERCSLTQEEFLIRLKTSNPNIELLDQYQNAHTPLLFKCKIHDIEFKTSPRTFLYKGGVGCPKCSSSYGEIKMNEILNELGLKVVNQYTFPDCININRLRFDAYDETNNIAFEYQGGQHYFPVDFAGKGEEWAYEQFMINKKRDNIKRDYCLANNIKLIEIPYWELDNGTMKEYIVEQLKQI